MKENNKLLSFFDMLIYGLGFTALFPATLFSLALFQHRRLFAFTISLIFNCMIFVILCWLSMASDFIWHQILLLTYGFNLLVTICIWGGQRLILGKAEHRYRCRSWHEWPVPLFCGVIVAYAMSALFSLASLIGKRKEMLESWDSLDRYTILIDILQSGLWGIPAGIVLGIIWVGRKKGFRVADLSGFLVAFGLFYIIIIFFEFLFHFGINGSEFAAISSASEHTWALFPSLNNDFVSYLNIFDTWNPAVFLALALLVSSCLRIRDFMLRVLIIVPIYLLMLFPESFASPERWLSMQHTIIYNLSSTNEKVRKVSAFFALRLFHRYPEHLQRPYIAEQLGNSLLLDKQKDKADILFRDIQKLSPDDPAWQRVIEHADLMLKLSNTEPEYKLKLQMIDHEKYLTENWLALLTIIRFWQEDELSESELKIRLRDISQNKDKIKLPDITHLAALDDAAANLGYETIFLHNNKKILIDLIHGGYPVLLSHFNRISILNSVDKEELLTGGYNYHLLPKRFKKEKFKEIRELFNLKKEGEGASSDQRKRIRRLTSFRLPIAKFDTPQMKYAAPVLAVVLPEAQIPELAKALNIPLLQLQKQSQGLLNTFISLSFIDKADPVQAIQWARTGLDNMPHPLPLYCIHNSLRLWEVRNQKIHSALQLEKIFPELAVPGDFIKNISNSVQENQAREQYRQDLEKQNPIPWMVLDQIIGLLDKNNSGERKELMDIARLQFKLAPSGKLAILQVDLHELEGNQEASIIMLQQAIAMRPMDSKLKLRLCRKLIATDDFQKASLLMKSIDRRKSDIEADYSFCRAAIAEWRGETDKALEYYEAAITMRKHEADYFLRYAALLQTVGREQEAQKLLNWAAKVSDH